jgi:non-homologous end joining protein Ku
MQGRQHLVGIKAHEHGLLSILRYAHELRSTEPYFEPINAEPPADVVKAPSR